MTAPKDRRYRVPTGFEEAFKAFQRMPNVGPATAEDLVRLRVKGVEDLAGRDPLAMYRALAELDGVAHDPCVLDVFMAAVDHARTGSRRAWWSYTAERKAMLEGLGAAATAGRPGRGTAPGGRSGRGRRTRTTRAR